MKKKFTAVVALVSMVSVLTVNAAYTESHDEQATYFTGIRDMSFLEMGLSGASLERKLKDSYYDLEGYTGSFFVGVDLFKIFTVYGKVGIISADFNSDIFGKLDGSDEFAYGVGISSRILSHDILDSFAAVDKVRVKAWAEYNLYSSDTARGDYEWEELYIGAVVGIVNEINGEPGYSLDSIALYFGPVYSTFFGDLEEEESIGLTIGTEVFFSPRISATLGVDSYDFDSPSINGAVTVQF
jgi:hypothetical protein